MRERKKKSQGSSVASCKVSSAIYTELCWWAFLVLMKGCQTDNTKIWWFSSHVVPLLKRNNMRRSSKNSLFQKPVNSCEGKATDWVSPPLSCPFSSGTACCTGTLRWLRQRLLRGYQGCDIEKQFVCREGNLGWISAIYNTALSLLIMFNTWHIIVIYYMQYIARVSLTSLWNVGRVSGQWGLWGEGSYQLANPSLPHSLQQLVMDC